MEKKYQLNLPTREKKFIEYYLKYNIHLNFLNLLGLTVHIGWNLGKVYGHFKQFLIYECEWWNSKSELGLNLKQCASTNILKLDIFCSPHMVL